MMKRDLAIGLLAPIGVFVLLLILGYFAIDQGSSPEILDQSVTQASSGDVDPFDAESDPFADDVAPTDGQYATYLENIAAGLSKWVQIVCGAGAVCAIFWFIAATIQQKKVVGPSGQDNSFVAWIVGLVLYAVITGVAYVYVIEPLEIDGLMDDAKFWAFVGLAWVSGLIAYWLATFFASSPVMAPSVPFAHLKSRSKD